MTEYAIGADELPGISKLIEEMGEVQQVIGRIIQCRYLGQDRHWDGSSVRNRLLEELADLKAATYLFLTEARMTDKEIEQFDLRYEAKASIFKKWHKEQTREEG